MRRKIQAKKFDWQKFQQQNLPLGQNLSGL